MLAIAGQMAGPNFKETRGYPGGDIDQKYSIKKSKFENV